jgi:hypothetical protein
VAGRLERGVVRVREAELGEQSAEREAVLAEFTECRVHPNLSCRAEDGRAFLVDGHAQRPPIEQPGALAQKLELDLMTW